MLKGTAILAGCLMIAGTGAYGLLIDQDVFGNDPPALSPNARRTATLGKLVPTPAGEPVAIVGTPTAVPPADDFELFVETVVPAAGGPYIPATAARCSGPSCPSPAANRLSTVHRP